MSRSAPRAVCESQIEQRRGARRLASPMARAVPLHDGATLNMRASGDRLFVQPGIAPLDVTERRYVAPFNDYFPRSWGFSRPELRGRRLDR